MRIAAYTVLLTLLLTLAGVACGSDPEPTTLPAATQPPAADPTPASTATQPAATATPAPPTPAPTPAPTAAPTAAPATAVVPPTEPPPAPTVTSAPEPTATPEPDPTATPEPSGPVAGPDSFIVGEGSKITFTVEEELQFSPVRFDAVISGTGLTGVANLDGSPTVIELDLHSLESDQNFRDRYIRQRMFPGTPTAVVTVDSLPELPQSFFDGETTSGTLEGSLQIGDTVTPLVFDVDARHDGSVINVLGRTTFTWEELGLATPVAGPVVFLDDEVRVQVLIVAHSQ